MSAYSVWHWVIFLMVLLLFVLPVWPAWRICRRAGISGAWGLSVIFPLFGLVLIWAFAFMDWPVERRAAQAVK